MSSSNARLGSNLYFDSTRRWLGMLGVTGLVLVLSSPAQADDDEAVMLQARAEYRQGLELYDARRYEDALEQFHASFKDFPSPNSLLYVARCLRLRRYLAP